MHAMVLKHFSHPLEWTELPDKQPGPALEIPVTQSTKRWPPLLMSDERL